MSFEVQTPAEKQLDAEWFDRYANESIEVYKMLDGDAAVRAAEKTKFLTSASGNPSLGYPALQSFNSAARQESLLK
jgi:hypothetical protein